MYIWPIVKKYCEGKNEKKTLKCVLWKKITKIIVYIAVILAY